METPDGSIALVEPTSGSIGQVFSMLPQCCVVVYACTAVDEGSFGPAPQALTVPLELAIKRPVVTGALEGMA